MNCSACRSIINEEKEQFLRCTVQSCNKNYHCLCTGEKRLTDLQSESWVCPECRCAAKRGGDNSSTPVGLTKRRDANVTVRSKTSRNNINDECCVDKSQNLTDEICELRSEVTKMREQLLKVALQMDKFYDKLCKCSCNCKEPVIAEPQFPPPVALSAAPHAPRATPAKPRSVPAPTIKQSRQAQKNRHVSSLRDTSLTPDAAVLSDTSIPKPPTATDDDGSWNEVRYKKSRQSLSLRCVAGPTITSLRAAESRKHFHLWNMLSELDEVKQYLGELCPARVITVEQLRTANSYNSFKIGVPEDCYDRCFSINVWPENARVKKWINYRKRSPASDGQTFHRGVGAL